jgi:hypothetical protein
MLLWHSSVDTHIFIKKQFTCIMTYPFLAYYINTSYKKKAIKPRFWAYSTINYDHLIIPLKLQHCLQSNLSFEINCTVYITYSKKKTVGKLIFSIYDYRILHKYFNVKLKGKHHRWKPRSQWKQQVRKWWTWGSHSNDFVEYYLLWCNAMYSGRSSLTFQRNI